MFIVFICLYLLYCFHSFCSLSCCNLSCYVSVARDVLRSSVSEVAVEESNVVQPVYEMVMDDNEDEENLLKDEVPPDCCDTKNLGDDEDDEEDPDDVFIPRSGNFPEEEEFEGDDGAKENTVPSESAKSGEFSFQIIFEF